MDGPPASAAAAESPASLDALETKSQPAGVSSGWRQRLHARHRKGREKVIAAFYRSTDIRLQKRSRRINDCCSWPKALLAEDGSLGLTLGRCRDRMCPLCSSCRSREAQQRIGAIALAMNSPRFATLTLRSSNAPLAEQLDKLFAAFRKLRRTVEWQRHVKGGVATLELTRNAERGTWHPHIHVLFDGVFFPQPLLKKAWHAATGDSFIVDVRAVHNREQAARYVAKYVGKPANFEPWPQPALCEYALALHGRRTIMTFGKVHTANPDPRDSGDRPKASRVLCSLMHVARMADAGYPEAQTLRASLGRLGHSWATVLGVQGSLPGCEPQAPTPSLVADLERLCDRAQRWAESGSPEYRPQPPPVTPHRQSALYAADSHH